MGAPSENNLSLDSAGKQLEVQDWRHHATKTIASAKSTQKWADESATLSRISHESARTDNNRKHGKVHNAFMDKIERSRRLVESLAERIKSVEASITLTKLSCAELSEARTGKKAPLQLITRRQELRHQLLPASERRRDMVEAALAEEKEIVASAHALLAEHAGKADKMIGELVRMHEELSEDLKAKTHSLQIDQDCVQAARSMGMATFHAPCKEPSSEEYNRTPLGFYASHPETQEHRRQLETVARIRLAKKKEEEADAFREESARAMRQAANNCAAAAGRTKLALDKSISEIRVIIQKMQEALKNQESRIGKMAQSLGSTAEEIACQEGPFNLATTRLTLRQQRKLPENIRDPVRAALDEQLKSLQANQEALESRQSQEKAMLSDLQAGWTKLKADLRDKQQALEADLKLKEECILESMPGYKDPEQSKKLTMKTMGSFGVGQDSSLKGKVKGGSARGAAVSAMMSLKIGTYANQHKWEDRLLASTGGAWQPRSAR